MSSTYNVPSVCVCVCVCFLQPLLCKVSLYLVAGKLDTTAAHVNNS